LAIPLNSSAGFCSFAIASSLVCLTIKRQML
jgi:hypothetical protein